MLNDASGSLWEEVCLIKGGSLDQTSKMNLI